MTEIERRDYQIRWLSEQLGLLGVGPCIGDCLQCGEVDDAPDCAGCWTNASVRVADASCGMLGEQMEKKVSASLPSIKYTRLEPEQWSRPYRDMLAVTRRGWLCWTWADMPVLNWRRDMQSISCVSQLVHWIGFVPLGTHMFWPCDDRDVFWSGIKRLGVEFVCVFGSVGASRVGLPVGEFRPLHWELRNGIVVATLWDFDSLAENPDRIGECAAFLKKTFRKLNINLLQLRLPNTTL